MEVVKRTVDGVRKPEYTGENRCLPCTVLNVLVTVVLAGAVAFVWIPAGVAVLLAGLAVIALRGYLIPGTPSFTAQYLPESVLRWFDKAESYEADELVESDAEETTGDAVDSDMESILRSANVVEVDEAADDLRLTDRFEAVWWRRIRRYRDDGAIEQLASILAVDPDDLSFESNDETGRVAVSFEEQPIGHWASEASFYADVAVEPTVREWLPEWEALDDGTRTNLIAGLRAFLETCPSCESDLEPIEDVRRSCCSGDLVRVNVDCEACGARVFTGSYR